MQWALVDKNNTIKNTLAYDGVSNYTPAEGLSLQQVNNWLGIGNNISDAAPSIDVNVSILQQIQVLEAIMTPRMLQEAITGSTNLFNNGTYKGFSALSALKDIRSKIDSLRSQLK